MGGGIHKWQEGSYLARPEEVDINIGIPSDRVDAILAEVFAHVLRGGLRQQPINAFPAMTYNSVLTGCDEYQITPQISSHPWWI